MADEENPADTRWLIVEPDVVWTEADEKERKNLLEAAKQQRRVKAIIREILSQDKLLVMFQNDERMRSGRFTEPTVGDISVEWLMQAYMSAL